MKAARLARRTLGGRKICIKNEVMKAAEQRLSAEFRNRIEQIVVFAPLTMEAVRQIAVLYLGRFAKQMEKQGKVVEITDRAVVY